MYALPPTQLWMPPPLKHDMVAGVDLFLGKLL